MSSIIFFLSYGRYQNSLPKPAEHLNSIFRKPAKENETNESESETTQKKDSQKKPGNTKRKGTIF